MGDLVRLSRLDLTGCQLQSLPSSITRCAGLTSLKLANNRLKSLPVQIGRVHGLRELDVHSNQLSVFPASVAGLPLYSLTVHDNPASSGYTSWEDFSVSPRAQFPPLMELTARFIAQHNISWKACTLPKSLIDFLSDCQECSTCEGPCFTFFSSNVTICPVGRRQLWLPLLDRCCSPHSIRGCKFKTLN
ncbi:uncharacterized protein LOC135468720 [Liolophura sinensis]|uniref:uncharacterized protein LOC135468720 n=1 Tax=Liolophura sinensis TaxID=3198878 RepID=UPI0031586DAD